VTEAVGSAIRRMDASSGRFRAGGPPVYAKLIDEYLRTKSTATIPERAVPSAL